MQMAESVPHIAEDLNTLMQSNITSAQAQIQKILATLSGGSTEALD